MIRARNLQKQFGALKVLDDVSFNIDQGKLVAVLGPNGSGKTTILKILLGMVHPQKGEVYIDDKHVNNDPVYRKQIRYLSQIATFPDNLKVNELIRMIKDVRNEPAHEKELISKFGLSKFLNKKLGNLSGGTRQKVNIVLTFMFDSNLIILDEPTAGLDPVSLVHLKDLILEEKKKGKTLLITTHIMSLVEELADEIVFLLEGNIYFQGSIDQLEKETGQSDLEHAIAKILEDQ